MVAVCLNENQKDMKQVIDKIILDIPATKANVKEMIWKPIEQAMFDKKSTKDLTTQDINSIYDIINKVFGEMGVSLPSFPSAEEQNLMETYGKEKNNNKM